MASLLGGFPPGYRVRVENPVTSEIVHRDAAFVSYRKSWGNSFSTVQLPDGNEAEFPSHWIVGQERKTT